MIDGKREKEMSGQKCHEQDACYAEDIDCNVVVIDQPCQIIVDEPPS